MLGSAVPATATLHTTTSAATPTSPTRPSRLRGLSYLRSYTHNHISPHLSSSSSTPRTQPPALTRSTSSPNTSPRQPSRPRNVDGDGDRERRTEPSGIQSGDNGWLPTVQGRSGLSRESLHPTSTSTESASRDEGSINTGMTRSSRSASMLGPTSVAATSRSARRQSAVERPSGNMDSSAASASTQRKDQQPTIRLIPHVEPRSTRPSLHFTALTRQLQNSSSIVRVGRYSERDIAMTEPNTLPVGFKSKVVSRRHCEFWCTNGQWYIKDVKSSSGTFLNHVRLSSPNQESRPFPVNDGDVVQLGIDFKGGEEVIFRCVKIRVECNRGWQKSLNAYNTTAHRKILKSAGIKSKARDSDAASVNSSECSICLNPVAPCQALFVAPCSHVWHYKCVRELIHGPNYPNFLCPNCRFVADLEADVEAPEDAEDSFDLAELEAAGESSSDQQMLFSEDDEAHHGHDPPEESANTGDEPERSSSTNGHHNTVDQELTGLLVNTSLRPSSSPSVSAAEDTVTSSSHSQPLAIANPTRRRRDHSPEILGARSTTPTSNTQFALAAGVMSDGPMTPRNDAGPFVFDGSAGRERPDGIAAQILEEESEQEHRI